MRRIGGIGAAGALGLGAVLGAAMLAASPAAAEELKLSCSGQGTYNPKDSREPVLRGDNVVAVGKKGQKMRAPTVVRVEMVDGAGRVRLPATLTPKINRGDKQGWFKLKEPVMDARRISGKFDLNVISNPSVTIDRTTGEITIKGQSIAFAGTCEKAGDGTAKF